MEKLVSALRMGTDLLYGEQQIYLNLCGVDILSISAKQVNLPDMQVGCLLG